MISILVPSLNYRRYIQEALSSCLSAGASVEVIVMDGLSVDGTVEYLNSIDRQITWKSEADLGQSDALNKSLSLSTGEIVGWLNADDFYLPGAIRLVSKFFEENPDVDVVFGDALLVDSESRITGAVLAHDFSRFTLRARGCFIPSTAAFFRRESLIKIGWDVRYRYLMDWDLFLQLDSAGARFIYVREFLAGFRVHDEQVTRTLPPRRSEEHRSVRRKHNITNYEKLIWLGDLIHKVQSMPNFSRRLSVRKLAGQHVTDFFFSEEDFW